MKYSISPTRPTFRPLFNCIFTCRPAWDRETVLYKSGFDKMLHGHSWVEWPNVRCSGGLKYSESSQLLQTGVAQDLFERTVAITPCWNTDKGARTEDELHCATEMNSTSQAYVHHGWALPQANVPTVSRLAFTIGLHNPWLRLYCFSLCYIEEPRKSILLPI